MTLSEYALQNKALIKFFIAVLIAGGVISFWQMSKMEDPEITVKQALIVTVYPGASAHEVELRVTDLLENSIRTMGDIDNIESKSMNDLSQIKVSLKSTVSDAAIQQKWDILRRKVNDVQGQLPEGASQSVVIDDFGDVYGMFFAMTNDGYTDQEVMDYARLARRKLEEIEGVSRIAIYGDRTPCINIEMNQSKMAQLGILPLELLNTLNAQSKAVYPGYFTSGEQRLQIEVSDAFRSIDDVRNLLIQGHEKDQFRLGDIAEVSEGYAEPARSGMRYDGQKALGFAVSMEEGYDILKVGKVVIKEMDMLQETRLPAGIEFHKIFYQPERVNNAINTFLINLIESILIVIFILMLTMGFRSGVIIGTGLLITVLGSFVVLHLFDGTLQRVSLAAFIVAMGMLVDNAIVVLDGILVDSERGMKPPQSLTNTANKTALPLLGATLIAILAFFPIFLSPDTAGSYVRDLFIVLAVSLLLSWVLALVHIPIHAASYLRIKPSEGKDIFDTPLYRKFRSMLSFMLSHRIVTLSVVVVLLLASGFCYRFLPQGFFPNLSYDQLYMEFRMPEGTRLERVEKDLVSIEDYLLQRNDIKHVTSCMGGTPARYNLVRSIADQSMGYGEMIIDFESPKYLEKAIPELQSYMTEHYPDAYIRIKRYNLMYMDYPIELMFTGPDPAVLNKLTEESMEIMRNESAVQLVTKNWDPAVPTLRINYYQPDARIAGISRSDVALSLLSATDGVPVGTFYEGTHAKPIYLKSKDNKGEQVGELENAPVWSMMPSLNILNEETIREVMSGSKKEDELLNEIMGATPLSRVTKGIALDWTPPVVRRYNGQRAMSAQCNNAAGYTAADARVILEKQINKQMQLPEGYSMQWMGEYKASSDSNKYLFKNLPLAIVLMISVLIYLFRDFRKPMIIVLCLPLAIIGVVFSMLISGKEFGFVAMVGALGLIGMMIKNGVVLIDEITLQMNAGVAPVKALLDSSSSRLRPVMMASGTTVLGMIPLLTDDMFGSMAVTIMGGLLVGTIITLMIIPVLYALFFGIKMK